MFCKAHVDAHTAHYTLLVFFCFSQRDIISTIYSDWNEIKSVIRTRHYIDGIAIIVLRGSYSMPHTVTAALAITATFVYTTRDAAKYELRFIALGGTIPSRPSTGENTNL